MAKPTGALENTDWGIRVSEFNGFAQPLPLAMAFRDETVHSSFQDEVNTCRQPYPLYADIEIADSDNEMTVRLMHDGNSITEFNTSESTIDPGDWVVYTSPDTVQKADSASSSDQYLKHVHFRCARWDHYCVDASDNIRVWTIFRWGRADNAIPGDGYEAANRSDNKMYTPYHFLSAWHTRRVIADTIDEYLAAPHSQQCNYYGGATSYDIYVPPA